MDTIQQTLESEWEKDTKNMFGSTSGGLGFGNVATAGISMFRAYTQPFVRP